MDFDNYDQDKVRLVRISFDGYGCYDLGQSAVPLGESDSQSFKRIIRENIKEQHKLLAIVNQAIRLNKELIEIKALEEYCLV